MATTTHFRVTGTAQSGEFPPIEIVCLRDSSDDEQPHEIGQSARGHMKLLYADCAFENSEKTSENYDNIEVVIESIEEVGVDSHD